MSAKRVLIIDDEPDFVRFLGDVLKRENFLVSTAADGEKGLRLAEETHPDLVLLDWNLPGKDGIEICRILKANAKTQDIPVIMLTMRGREADAVLGLEMGADDYITKRALRPRELAARVHAALRKSNREEGAGRILTSGAISLDTSRRQVTVDKRALDLRTKEFDLLCLFLTKKGHVLTRNFIAEMVWEQPYFDTSRTMDTTIARLRVKMGKEGRKITAVKNVGYKFDEEA